jgi:hypothetical protein
VERQEEREGGTMRKLKILVALAASIAAIAIGTRQQNDNRQKDARTQKARVQDVDSESLFV